MNEDAKILGLTDRLKAAATRFARDESGAILAFSVYIFLLIMMVGGIGADIMYSELRRTKLQHTLDRAILAAADLDQEADAATVVNEYFDAAGMSGYLSSVSVDEGLNYRVVSAEATSTANTYFMKLMGIDTLTVPAIGTAEERVGEVEVSLVLDVSGSMGWNSRLTNLKSAAKDFVDTMETNTQDGELSISIVPYATQVSGTNELYSYLNVSDEHNYSNCVNFTSDDFNTAEIDHSVEMERTMHFDPWGDRDGRDDDPMELVRDPVCEDDDSREMLLYEENTTTLKDYIDDLFADGNTSIDVGMKWGTALLDPSMQDVVSDLIADGEVSADFEGRPYEYDNTQSLKVIVLMTDGANTSQYYIEDDYRSGESNIWWNEQEEIYSVYVGLDDGDYDDDDITNEMMFYWPHEDEWVDHAYGEGQYEEETETQEWVCKSYKKNGSCKKYKKITTVTIEYVDEPGEAVALDYPDLWAYTTLEWNVEEHYEPWMYDSYAWNDWYYDVRSYVGSSTKNTRTNNICNAAKDAGIIVFTIAFEASSSGQTVLSNCASSDSHYFDVDGLEINDAFAAIATSIAQLKLTQ